jgi:catechol 2,3-dioxygenase-like lactoylglutathione lyase family enzyme
MLKGINHLTIAVSDLDRAITFYQQQLAMQLKVRWVKGAYLTVGELWLCLSVDIVKPSKDYSHIAFDIDEQDFVSFSGRLLTSGVDVWKQNKSEGCSLYLLDPDGNKLEIHVGNLTSRIAKMKENITDDMIFYDQ